uniref:Uncharacterized protein n=1 Tax=viral metagenome TaxID=1070528 RepID=A0A6C0EMK9_9ZZZZ
MDVSLNLIDLQYLTNTDRLTKLMQKKDLQQISRDDLDFYKKRIFQLTKDMLRGEKINTKVNKSFVNYAQMCIDHFKFIDKMELIQNDYKDIKSPVNKKNTFNMKNSNSMMLRKKPHQPRITDNIKIKSTRINTPIVMPKTRTFNLKDVRFREKGLKKKNINDI